MGGSERKHDRKGYTIVGKELRYTGAKGNRERTVPCSRRRASRKGGREGGGFSTVLIVKDEDRTRLDELVLRRGQSRHPS